MKLLSLVSILVLSVCGAELGQSSDNPVTSSDAQKSSGKPVDISDAQRSFDLLKTLAGTWKGPIAMDNPAWSTDQRTS